MGTGPRKQPLSPTDDGRTHSGGTPPALTELLTREGAPWRPFSDKGVLVKAQKTPRDAKAIFAACERTLVSHLKAVCLWPAKERNRSWRAGDHSFYILDFMPAPETMVYVQFWSEPDEDGAIFEVSSGAWNPPADKYVDPEKQELLRDHGFEIGGNADNFRKIFTIEGAKDLRAMAREAVAILTKVLGYDGTLELRYQLQLETAYAMRHVLTEVSPYTLQKLMREWGFPAELKVEKGRAAWIESRTDHGQFGVVFGGEAKEGSGRYHAVKLRTFRQVEPEDVLAVANLLNRGLPSHKVTVDDDGDLVIETEMRLYEGVTAEHLKSRFELWREMMRRIAAGAG